MRTLYIMIAMLFVSMNSYNGGPYVMWKDTPYAHIMVPIKATE